MRGRRVVVVFGSVAMTIAALGACGGSDDTDDAGGETAEPNESTTDGADDETTTADDVDQVSADGNDGDDEGNGDGSDADGDDDGDDGTGHDGDDGNGDDSHDSDDGTGGGEYRCDDIFSMSEIEAWFGEPAALTEDRMDAIGQIVCNWETIEDPTDTDDLAFQLITAQIFTGEGVPAESFIDPEIFEEVTMIDDVGDLAFYEESFGRGYYFLDGSIAGSFSVSEVDMGAVDAPKRHTAADVDALFRDFHARVTG